jgi:hypothetical protein
MTSAMDCVMCSSSAALRPLRLRVKKTHAPLGRFPRLSNGAQMRPEVVFVEF